MSSPKSKTFFLVNSRSGAGKGAQLLESLDDLIKKGVFYGVANELCNESLTEQVSHAQEFDRIVVAGGDGTVSEALARLVGSEKPVGILPLGTANDLSRELGFHERFQVRHLPRWLGEHQRSRPVPLAVWQLAWQNSTASPVYFCNYLSFGFDAEIIAGFHHLRERLPRQGGVLVNRAAYGLVGLQCLASKKIQNISLHADNGQKYSFGPLRSLFFTNISSVMGFGKSSRCASGFDTRLECLSLPSALHFAEMGLRSFLPLPERHLAGSSARWTVSKIPKETAIQKDGEPVSPPPAVSAEISLYGFVPVLQRREN